MRRHEGINISSSCGVMVDDGRNPRRDSNLPRFHDDDSNGFILSSELLHGRVEETLGAIVDERLNSCVLRSNF